MNTYEVTKESKSGNISTSNYIAVDEKGLMHAILQHSSSKWFDKVLDVKQVIKNKRPLEFTVEEIQAVNDFVKANLK